MRVFAGRWRDFYWKIWTLAFCNDQIFMQMSCKFQNQQICFGSSSPSYKNGYLFHDKSYHQVLPLAKALVSIGYWNMKHHIFPVTCQQFLEKGFLHWKISKRWLLKFQINLNWQLYYTFILQENQYLTTLEDYAPLRKTTSFCKQNMEIAIHSFMKEMVERDALMSQRMMEHWNDWLITLVNTKIWNLVFLVDSTENPPFGGPPRFMGSL